jgi:glutamate formiminotransferase
LKTVLANYNAGVVVVNSEVVGMAPGPGLPDFSQYNIPKGGKVYPLTIHKKYQLAIK